VKTAISYIRFSLARQARGVSLERQLDGTRKFCQRHGLVLDENLTIKDLGQSAFRGKNADEGNLRAFLDAARSGRLRKGTVLVVEALDRLTRDRIVRATHLITDILINGVDIGITLMDKVYSEEHLNQNPHEMFVAVGLLLKAGKESEDKSDRIRDAWQRKKERIRSKNSVERIPLPCWLERHEEKYKVDRTRAKVVQRIFKEYNRGKGLGVLTNLLNQEKVPVISKRGRKGNKWHSISIHRLLTDKAVIGTYDRTEPVKENYFPAIVDSDLFYATQARLHDRKRYNGRIDLEDVNLFKGLVTCRHCGGTMFMFRHRRQRRDGMHIYRYLKCLNSRNGACDAHQHADLSALEYIFLAYTCESTNALRLFSSIIDHGSTNASDGLTALDGELEDVERGRKNLAKAIERGGEIDVLVGNLKVLDEKKKVLRQRREELQSEESRRHALPQAIQDYRQLVERRAYDNTEGRLRLRELIRSFLHDITIDPKTMRVRFRLRSADPILGSTWYWTLDQTFRAVAHARLRQAAVPTMPSGANSGL
jgi:DNA invertase Pin-like site-specific DNA recombinase